MSITKINKENIILTKVQPLSQRLNLFFAVMLLVIGFFLCVNIASATTFSKPVNNLGLVGYWPFDEGSGTIAHDFSGNKKFAVASGTPTWVSGRFGKAIHLNGFDQNFNVDYIAPKIASGSVTISSWVKLDSVYNTSNSDYMTVFTLADSPSNNDIRYSFHASGRGYFCTNFTLTTPDFCAASFLDNWPANTWYNIIVVYNDSTGIQKLYVDGVLNDTESGTVRGSVKSVLARIGSDMPEATYLDWFTGTIDDMRIYNRVISLAEVAAIYKAGSVTLGKTNATADSLSKGLIGHWTMDGKDTPWSSATIGTVIDKSGNGRTGTLTNMKQTTSPVIGKVGQALKFNGTSQYIDFGNISAFDMGTNDWTYSAWIKANSTSVNIILTGKLSYVGGGNPDAWQSGISLTGRLQGKLFKSGGTTFTPIDDGAVLTDNKWHYITVVWNRSGNLLRYVDGVISGTELDISSLSGQNISNTQSFQIGARDQVGDELYFPGLMDDVRIYNRALSPIEILKLYRSNTVRIFQQT